MRRLLQFTLFALLCVVIAGCNPTPPKPDPDKPDPGNPDPGVEPSPDLTAELAALHGLHNGERADRSLRELTVNGRLNAAAQKHAQWMADNNVMDHTGENGSSFWQRVRKEGYFGRGGGENIAAGYRTPEAVFKGWMNSSGHRRNIRGPNWEHIGLGVAVSRTGTKFWCVVFAYGGADNLPASHEPDLMLPEPIEWAE